MLGPTDDIQWSNTDCASSEQHRIRPLIVGNWKMNGLAEQLSEIEAMAVSVKATLPSLDALICLPATLIAQAVFTANGRIAIGGEDCSAEICGPFTGDISAEMLIDAGARAVIVGHSERRQQHGEMDAVVAAKAQAARRAGLLAIICIGETHTQRLAGKALSVCATQIAGSVPEDMTASNTVIGYEPLWAIGSGQVPTQSQIMEMHAHIRACLTQRLGAEGQTLRILYGGSVKPSSAEAILRLPQVGGVLVGGASLNAADFLAICRAAPVGPAHILHTPKEQIL
ncbi:triose-phosphate isomerase [Pseudomonas lurida]|nr:triose-phosphate isomerase [Pseudomonas lurida]